MPTLPEASIVDLLAPYIAVSKPLASQFADYLDLLLRWNARTNLTAIRSPEEMVRRHFGESLFVGLHLGEPLPETLLDLGSGAGFPGVPIALLRPGIRVTLAESQNKKATFLREVVRSLGLENVEVWAGRAEDLPSDRRFHTVAMRAVDNMAVALAVAAPRAERQIVLLTTEVPQLPEGFVLQTPIATPESKSGVVVRAIRA